ncbi:unnamed protein product [Boreogadus saida]
MPFSTLSGLQPEKPSQGQEKTPDMWQEQGGGGVVHECKAKRTEVRRGLIFLEAVGLEVRRRDHPLSAPEGAAPPSLPFSLSPSPLLLLLAPKRKALAEQAEDRPPAEYVKGRRSVTVMRLTGPIKMATAEVEGGRGAVH